MRTVDITLDVVYLGFIAGVIIPFLVAAITKLNASSQVKALSNLVLSGVAAAVDLVLAANGHVDVRAVVIAFGTVVFASGASYHGVTKPLGLTGAVAESTADKGIG